jgi:gliding motility-associated-like protein
MKKFIHDFYFIFLLLLVFLSNRVSAQKEDNTWIFGLQLGLDFNQSPPSLFQTNMLSTEGCASVSDIAGNLLFYSNGNDVWDANGNIMPNGSGLLGNGMGGYNVPGSATQGVAVIRSVADPKKYFLFTLDADEQIVAGSTPGYLRYSVVDLSLNGGLGDVSATEKNIILDSFMSERMIATKGEGCSYWLITHRGNSTLYKAFKVDENGLNPVPVTSSGMMQSYIVGEMAISPDGNMLAWCSSELDPIEVALFNKVTGMVTNAAVLDTPTTQAHYGLEFSPDNSKLYSSELQQIVQYDMGLWPDINAIKASKNVIHFNTIPLFWGMRLAPDNRIYICSGFAANPALARINNPNAAGIACDFELQAVPIPPGIIFPVQNLFYGFGMGNGFFVNRSADTIINPSKDTVTCFKSEVILQIGDYDDYLWSDGSTGRTLTVSQSGTYWVTGFKKCQIYIDSIHLNMVDFNTALGNDTIICPGDQLLLDVTVPGATYQWQNGSSDATLAVNEAGTFSVAVTKDGCTSYDTIQVNIEEPRLEIALPDTLICAGSLITLYADAVPVSDYLWNTGQTSASIIATATGTYRVTATNMCGTLTDSVTLTFQDCSCPVFVPNVFTPNGDGNNEHFEIKIRCQVLQFDLSIYNRYGQRIFHTADPQEGWDGQYKGTPADIGTYFYYLNYTGPDNTKFNKKGDVTLFR